MVADAVAGTGSIDSYTVDHQQWMRVLEVPYVITRVPDAPYRCGTAIRA